MVAGLATEIRLRAPETKSPLQTIYWGGGTPSLLSALDLET
ncbi:MAG: coproporphyrinogen III oxidase, partial [Sphingobacteriia bacterium]